MPSLPVIQGDLDEACILKVTTFYWAQALATKSGTMTPLWVGLWVMLKYRTSNNYRSPVYLMGRLFDKTIFTFLICTFYLWVGRNDTTGNEPNIAGLLFMWYAAGQPP